MAEGTRSVQVAEAITSIRGETNSLREEVGRQGALMEKVLQQLNNLASNYDSLVNATAKQHQNSEEGTSISASRNVNTFG